MTHTQKMDAPWPELPAVDAWQETYDTVHRWTQIVGKLRMEHTPWINHSWHVPLYVTTRGLTTSPMAEKERTLEIDFDFVDHRLHLASSNGEATSFRLEPMAVADFYDRTVNRVRQLGFSADIWTQPVEIPGDLASFDADTDHAAYDADAIHRVWRALVQADRVFTEFRAGFSGKVSPVHFFWGAFDLAVTRFSGRTAPTHPGGAPNCADWVMEEAYSHELSSAGFWPGAGLGEPAFYSYAYPEPDGFRDSPVQPDAAYYHDELGEFVLPYDELRLVERPGRVLLNFLQTTYEAAAELGEWDRKRLERAG